MSDCSFFLRPRINICVQSASDQSNDNSSSDPVWVDAKINSIQRNAHDSECSCQYYVSLYVNQGSFSTKTRILGNDIKVLGLNQISILQKLEHPCEGQPHRWSSSEDCFTVPQTKLLLGKFLSDLSWLIMTSVLYKDSFCARSVHTTRLYIKFCEVILPALH